MDQFTSNWRARARHSCWPGLRAEHVVVVSREPHEFEFSGDCHFVAFGHHGTRREGETLIDGASRSMRREFTRSLVFVPSGMKIRGWSVPEKPSTWLNLYIDPKARFVDPEFSADLLRLEPRLHVDAPALWATGEKIATLLTRQPAQTAMEAETLCSLLMLELAAEVTAPHRPAAGGLGRRRALMAESYIRDHLEHNMSLASLAAVVGLTPGHFLRAFRETFGMPPHAYVLARRIEHAKELLADRSQSITAIALATGFCDSSHFATAFKKSTGVPPSRYRAALL
jgi:AraC family transcriptional regulator